MRVLQVAASLADEWGGPTATIAGLTTALESKGVECTVFAAKGKRVGTEVVALGAVRSRLFPTGSLAGLWTGYARGMAASMRRELPDYDLVHVHELWHYPGFAAYRAARGVGKPYIVSLHGGLAPWALGHKVLRKRLYMKAVQRRVLDSADSIHAMTSGEAQQVRDMGITTPVSVVPNGIPSEAFDDLPAGCGAVGLNARLDGKQVVLYLGRIHPGKGLDILARAFGEIASARGDVCLVIAGPDEGGYKPQVEAALLEAGVSDNTVWTGMLTGSDKRAAFSSADVFVLPSYSEGFSIAVLEAMASGLPVVISRQCYFPEVADHEAGLVVETNVRQVADALAYLLEHPDEGRAMGERGRQSVRDSYTWEAVAEKMIGLYERVLSESPGQRV